MSTKLTVNAWTRPTDRETKIVSILGQLPGAREGAKFTYRGMTLEKHSVDERSRREPELVVYDPDGHRVISFQPVEMQSYEIVEMLDEIRSQWVDARRASSQ
jgi:hypothetical protein